MTEETRKFAAMLGVTLEKKLQWLRIALDDIGLKRVKTIPAWSRR